MSLCGPEDQLSRTTDHDGPDQTWPNGHIEFLERNFKTLSLLRIILRLDIIFRQRPAEMDEIYAIAEEACNYATCQNEIVVQRFCYKGPNIGEDTKENGKRC